MSDAGLKGSTVFHNLTPAQLYEKARPPPPPPRAAMRVHTGLEWGEQSSESAAGVQALTHEPGTHIMCNGALATLSGARTSAVLSCGLSRPCSEVPVLHRRQDGAQPQGQARRARARLRERHLVEPGVCRDGPASSRGHFGHEALASATAAPLG